MKKTITINGKEYEIKPINFKALYELGELGFDVDEVNTKTMKCARILCAYTMQCDFETVDKEVDAHMASGGSIVDLKPLFDNIAESDFFRNIPK